MERYGHPFAQEQTEKDVKMTEKMLELTGYHRENCAPYRRMLEAVGYEAGTVRHYADLPFLPVTLFKKIRLSSLKGEEDYTVLTSSGTGGQQKSQIILDGDTRAAQQQALAAIGVDYLGGKRMPMLVIDCPSTVKNRLLFSARTAGILGFSLFGRERTFALRDEDLSLDLKAIEGFLERFGNERFLIFGFTSLVWKNLVLELQRRKIRFDLSNGVLVHGGGWKKLTDQAVSKEEFKQTLYDMCGLETVIDYYGMAEQSGSIFMECPCGHLHCSDYSAVLMRRPQDFSLCGTGETGLIQVMSVIPKSYPGHNLLTEDEGRILGVDDCPCGRKGTYFEVLGRAKNAELRGCSEMAVR